MNNLRILSIKNAKFSGYYFYMNLNIYRNFQICISVPLIHSMKFLFAEVALYLYKSTIRPCMEYFCHVWAGAYSYYLELLDKLQNVYHDCWSFTCCLPWTRGKSLKCNQLSPFYKYCFGRCSSELAELVPLLYSQGRSGPNLNLPCIWQLEAAPLWKLCKTLFWCKTLGKGIE